MQRGPTDMQHILHPMTSIIRVMGGWPIRRVGYGYAAIPLWSANALRRLAWFFVLSVYIVFDLTESMKGYSSDNFVGKTVKIVHFLMETWMASIPLTQWPMATDLARHLNSWRQFQARWVRVTGMPFAEAAVQQAVVVRLAVAAIVGSVLSIAMEVQVAPDMYFWKAPLYALTVTSLICDTVVWCVLHDTVCIVSRNMRRHFQRELDSRELSVEILQEYFLLWMRLRDLLLGITAALEPMWVRYVTLVTLTGVTSLFVVCACCVTGDHHRAVSMTWLALNMLTYVTTISLYGDYAEHEVKRVSQGG